MSKRLHSKSAAKASTKPTNPATPTASVAPDVIDYAALLAHWQESGQITDALVRAAGIRNGDSSQTICEKLDAAHKFSG